MNNMVWFNGQYQSAKETTIFPFFQALNYGLCTFEGIRCYQTPSSPAVFRLDEHIERFFRSAKTLRMTLPFTENELKVIILETAMRNKLTDGYIRPLAFYSDTKLGINILDAQISCLVLTWPKEELTSFKKPPAHITISSYIKASPRSYNYQAKISGSYITGVLGYIEAREAGYDESIFLDESGYLTEGTVNNIFVVKDRVIYTPTTRNILPGITRDTILQIAPELNLAIREQDIGPEFLKEADEIFLSGTGIELERVEEVRGYYQHTDNHWPVAEQLEQSYRQITNGENKTHQHWLSYLKTK